MEMKIGSVIRRFRYMAGLTAIQLAHKTGITLAALAHYEGNRHTPSHEVLQRMSDVFKEVLGPSVPFIKQIQNLNEKTTPILRIVKKESRQVDE